MQLNDTYIDGFVFPIKKKDIQTYHAVAARVAQIWCEYGALSYQEFLGDTMKKEGTRSFIDAIECAEDEIVLFGWVVFPDKATRDDANEKVPKDPRMEALVVPLVHADRKVFDAKRMLYGGFETFVSVHKD